MLGLGTAGAAGLDAKMADAVCAATKDVGVRLIDTAQNYGSEAAIGDGLRRSGVTQAADGLFISAKVDLASRAFEEPVARVRRQVGRTLERLGVARLDAVVIHWPLCLDKPCAEAEHAAARRAAWGALEALVAEGVVGAIGVSNWSVPLLDELLGFATIRPALNQVEVSPACPQAALREYCAAQRIAVVGYSPYGGCWIADSWPDAAPWGEDLGGNNLLQHWAVEAVAADAGCTPAQALLRWAMQRGVVPIPKSVRPARIAEALKAHGAKLSDEQMGSLDALADPRRGVEASLAAHARIIAHGKYKWPPT